MIRASWFGAPGAAYALVVLAGCDAKIVDPADRIPPQLEITSPAAGSVVSGVSFLVTADATDDQGIDRVEFAVVGFEPVAVGSAPYETRLVSFGQDEGAVAGITVTAFDVAGNATADFITVEVGAQTVTRITTNVGADLNPSWSPDGSLIVYQSVQSGSTGTYDLWTIAPDGSNRTRITFDVQSERNPAWSPDGMWIAFDSNRTLQYEVYKMPVGAFEAGIVPLTFANNDDVEPAWDPLGEFVYFASNRGSNAPFNIWRVLANGDGATTEQITSFANPDRAPSVSPSGRFLAFTSTLNFATPHVYLLDLGVGVVAPLSGDLGFTESEPAWAQGGGEVVSFGRSTAGSLPPKVWVQDALGSAVLQGTFGTGTQGETGAVWSPDGTKIAFHSDRDGNLDLFVIE